MLGVNIDQINMFLIKGIILTARDGNREPVLVKDRFPVDRLFGIISQSPLRFCY